MKFARWVVCCVLMSGVVAAWAGSPVPVDVQHLKGQIVFLRGMEAGKKLSFDASGNLIGSAKTAPFTGSVLKIDKVRESKTNLEIKGERFVLVSVASSSETSLTPDFYFVRIGKSVKITIALDTAQPESLDRTVNKIFAFSLRDDLKNRPSDDVAAALNCLALNASQVQLLDTKAMSKVRIMNLSTSSGASRSWAASHRGATPPILIPSVKRTPLEHKGATREHPDVPISEIYVVRMVVDAHGRPTMIHILYSRNPKLNPLALEAIRQYRFIPAIRKGQPVAIAIQIESAFHIKK